MSIESGHFRRLVLVKLPVVARPPRVGGAVSGRLQQPRRQRTIGRDRRRLLRHDDEHRLRHILGQRFIAHLPPGRGVDNVDVALHDERERILRSLLRVNLQPIQFFHHINHSPASVSPPGHRTKFRRTDKIRCMRTLLCFLAAFAWALWLGGLMTLFLMVSHLFSADRNTAVVAAPRMFLAFERYQILLAAALLVASAVWRLREPRAMLTGLFFTV